MTAWLVRIGIRPIAWLLCVGVAVACTIGWVGSAMFADARLDVYVAQQTLQARSDARLISSNLNQRLVQDRSIAQTLALDQAVIAALARFGPHVQASALPQPARGAVWHEDTTLQHISQRLSRTVEYFGLNTLWLTNAAGDTVAEGHAAGMAAFIGTNYADRDYFKAAQQGLIGRQFAIGRVTNVYGLFFSTPVHIDGQFVGMVGTGISVPRLSPAIEQVNAVVTDDLGVIVLAKDPALLMQTMPGVTVNTLSPEAREKRYKRTNFEPVDISPRSGDGQHALYRWRGEPAPVVMESLATEDGSLRVHVLRDMGETLTNKRADQLWWFGLVSLLVLVTAALLGMTAQFLIKTSTQQQALLRLNAALALEAHTDALTGCANRRYFLQLFAQERDRSKRYHFDLCLLSLDIDHFKQVNDTHGHAAGDEVLKHFVATIQRQLRQVDTLGRLGGEQFSILLPQTSADSATLTAERIRASVASEPAVFGTVNIAITVSIGGVQWRSDSDLPLECMLSLADDALYSAKNGGRNRVVWALSPKGFERGTPTDVA
jgi:diguanylate cyclase (GGDEF)-like protein